jgi:hypothetical protein
VKSIDLAGCFVCVLKVLAGGKSGGKNAIPPFGRKRIFAAFGATLFLKHWRSGFPMFLKKGCGKFD